jgi:hypothetical protein
MDVLTCVVSGRMALLMHVKLPRKDVTPLPASPARAHRKLFAVLALSMMMACRDEVSHARVKKEAPSQAVGAPAMGSIPATAQGDVPAATSPTGSDGLKWQLPKGWQESKAGGMRYATLKPPVPGKVDVSIVVLPGSAGGELANVNRWRGQIGLVPIDDAALASARRPVRSPAGTVSVYDFTSDGQVKTRMIAALLVTSGNSWFLKMVGDADAVGAARSGFMHLLETLRFD